MLDKVRGTLHLWQHSSWHLIFMDELTCWACCSNNVEEKTKIETEALVSNSRIIFNV